MKKLFLKNKVLFLLTSIIIISIILIIIGLFVYFVKGSGKTVYGDRLVNIENYKIDKDIKNKLEEIYIDSTVDSVKYDLKGKIIYIKIDLKENLPLVDAQTLSLKAIDVFSEEQRSYYDIQLIVTTSKVEEKSKIYPIFGYKNAKNTQVVWTN